ncbi:MAG TPA: hypothetical protein VK943_17715 [Arenibaculum sp.]|nr:hypothetical protein [Arenibaculum sp.]
MTNQIKAASWALFETIRRARNAVPLIPAMSGCPDCRRMWMITSPAPLGPCPDCGVDLEVLPASRIAAQAPSAPTRAA